MGIKIRDILKIVKVGTSIGGALAPGAVGSILGKVTESINDPEDRHNEAGLKALGQMDDEQNQAILALHERVKKLEERARQG